MTRAGYYAWRARAESAHAAQDRALLEEIRRLFARHRDRYGNPRIHHDLQERGIRVSRPRVARLMRADGLRAKAVRGYRGKAGGHRFHTAHPNLVRRHPAARVDQVWAGDITYLAVAGRWRLLAVVMDRCSRRIFAWTLQGTRTMRVTRTVLAAALRRRRPGAGLIFHSDRGTEYLGQPFRRHFEARGIRQSASTA